MVKDTLPEKVVHNKKGEIMPQKKKRLFIDKIEKVMFLHKQGNMKETQTTRHIFRSVYFLVSIFQSLFYSMLYFTDLVKNIVFQLQI